MVRFHASLGLALVLGATALRADSWHDCSQDRDLELSIKGCTAIIASNPQAGWAYFNRGNAYRARGDSERAIADFSKAIELDPKGGADALFNRGEAYRI